MKLDDLLAWDEGLFRGLWRATRALRGGRAFDPARAATLEPLVGRLALLAQAVAGRRLLLRPAEAAGGVRGAVLLLPGFVDLAPSPAHNAALYRLRTVVAAAMASESAPPSVGDDRVDALHRAARAAERLRSDLPAFGDAFAAGCALTAAARPDPRTLGPRGRLLERAIAAVLAGDGFDAAALATARRAARDKGPDAPPVVLWGDALAPSEVQAADRAAAEAGLATRPPDGTEARGRPRDAVTRATLDPEAPPEGRPIHSFEKAECLDSWQGGARTLDGADELEDHLEALDEVDLRQILRGGPDAHAILRADVDLAGGIPDVEDAVTTGGVRYDEWDARARRYRRDWTTVYPEDFEATAPAWGAAAARRHGATVRALVHLLSDQRLARAQRRRQTDGEDVDLDALVDAWADRLAGHTADERLYVAARPDRRDRVTTALLDVSLSAESWIEDRRVLDVTREAALVLGQTADALGDPLALAAFASNTRHHNLYATLKRWDEPWRPARDRLGALTARGYTRLGPALRHATAGLAGRPERHRLLLLLTDGKPTDFDRYEGRHGREDVASAVREANARGVVVHALAFDPDARAALPAMFGAGGWSLVRHPGDLPAALTLAYGRLVARRGGP